MTPEERVAKFKELAEQLRNCVTEGAVRLRLGKYIVDEMVELCDESCYTLKKKAWTNAQTRYVTMLGAVRSVAGWALLELDEDRYEILTRVVRPLTERKESNNGSTEED